MARALSARLSRNSRSLRSRSSAVNPGRFTGHRADPAPGAALNQTLRGMDGEGLTLIVISHKLHELIEAADRVVILRRGAGAAVLPPWRSRGGHVQDSDLVIAVKRAPQPSAEDR